ncbi:FMN-binding negative transcriptional regulator [Deinococcus sp. KSM4-11]|uniref:FMN-binding negative transcriptional regulator n=1 Tax=Deinococcus sp. KSM4-11 TaxID=2568654 RepID=UPI0010A2AFC5|nr:FMN-binding negative transcriptional regulator [Deinococcus sp. KSM4-11]THF86653.1 FMN-binding negative transcriptional regulator [Deinococcus sp. KSM4-11]
MYVPAHFRNQDQAELLAFMRAHPFVMLVTAPGGVPFATHLPMLVEPDADGGVFLRSHLARANPQWQHFGSGRDVLVIFHGPHALIDPAWYASAPNVPTWNYAAVHATGPARVVDGDETRRIAFSLVAQFTPDMAAIPPDFERRMLAGVVTFEVRVARLEGKFKLSQNKTAQDRVNVHAALAVSGRGEERETAALMAQAEAGRH